MNQTRIKLGVRQAARALLFYLLLFLFMLPLTIAMAIFIVLYALAMFGPWLSGKFAVKNRFRWGIDLVFGIDPILRFRDDIKSLVGKHAKLEIGERTAPEIRSDIYELHQKASDQAERGEFIVAIVTGIVSLIAGTLTGISVIAWLLGTYSVVMTLTIGLHVVILDILAYNRTDDLSPYRREHLVVLEGWNRAILTNHSTQASVLMVGVLYRISPLGYQIAKELLDEAMGQDMSRWEQTLFVSFAIAKMADEIITEGWR